MFQPVLPSGGYLGWRYLQRTLDQQQDAFRDSAPVKRLTDHFRANVAKADTAEELVKDRRLLEVALGAFGLSDDLRSRAFIQRVLEGGTMKQGALANRLADKRYEQLAFEFGYGNLGSRTGLPGFADRIIARYEANAFQKAVGEKDNGLRLALNAETGLSELTARTKGQNAQWYGLMGNPPLRQVMETALGLPRSFGALDVDRQLATFKERARSAFGTDRLSEIAAPERRETLIRLYLIRSDTAPSAAQPQSLVLGLLQRSG